MTDTARMAREAGIAGFLITSMNKELERLIALARADEREKCAKQCEDDYGHVHHIALSCAAALRAGGGG
jgi:hypothetical protein